MSSIIIFGPFFPGTAGFMNEFCLKKKFLPGKNAFFECFIGREIRYNKDPGFDYETNTKYEIAVHVKDSSLKGLPKNLTVNMINCNDPPLAVYISQVVLSESTAPGTSVAMV